MNVNYEDLGLVRNRAKHNVAARQCNAASINKTPASRHSPKGFRPGGVNKINCHYRKAHKCKKSQYLVANIHTNLSRAAQTPSASQS